jgi:hypothetical protein
MGDGLPSGVNGSGKRPSGRPPAYAFSDRLAPEWVIGMDRNR